MKKTTAPATATMLGIDAYGAIVTVFGGKNHTERLHAAMDSLDTRNTSQPAPFHVGNYETSRASALGGVMFRLYPLDGAK